MVKKFFNFLQGRSTTFAVYFSITGFILACFDKLSMSYVALVSAIQGYVVLHSAKEDYFKKDGNDPSHDEDSHANS